MKDCNVYNLVNLKFIYNHYFYNYYFENKLIINMARIITILNKNSRLEIINSYFYINYRVHFREILNHLIKK